MNDPLRKVVSVENFIDTPTVRNWLKMECGHEKSQKGSIRIPERARCRDCGCEARRRDAKTGCLSDCTCAEG